MNQRYRGITLAVVGACFWGASGTAVEFLFSNTNVDTSWLVGLRLIFSGILLMLYACYKYWDKVKAMFHDKKAVIMLILFAFWEWEALSFHTLWLLSIVMHQRLQ